VKLKDTDIAVLRAAHLTPIQTKIAKAAGTSPSTTTHSLLKLAKGGALTLVRRGQTHAVTLAPAIGAVLTAMQTIEDATRTALECMLEPKSEAA
jgi:hypothetical protein